MQKSKKYGLWGGFMGFFISIAVLFLITRMCTANLGDTDHLSLVCESTAGAILIPILILSNAIFSGENAGIDYFGFSPFFFWSPVLIVVGSTVIGMVIGILLGKFRKTPITPVLK